MHCTEVRFASFLSGESITALVVNPTENKLAKHLSVHWTENWQFNLCGLQRIVSWEIPYERMSHSDKKQPSGFCIRKIQILGTVI